MTNHIPAKPPDTVDSPIVVVNEVLVEAFRLFFRTGAARVTETFERALAYLTQRLGARSAWFILWPGSRETQGSISEWDRETGFHAFQQPTDLLQKKMAGGDPTSHSVCASVMQDRSLVAFLGVEEIPPALGALVQQTAWLQSLGDIFWAAFERNRHQQTIEAEKHTLAQTLLSLGDGVITTSTSGCITLMNASAGEILEVSPAQALQQPLEAILQLQDPADAERLAEFLHHSHNGSSSDFSAPLIRIETPSRIRKILSIRGNTLQSPEPAMRGCVLMFRDCTEQIRLDAQNALSQKMESIGRLAAGIAHEINTPMQFIGDNRRFLADALQGLTRVLEKYQSGFQQMILGREIPETMNDFSQIENEVDLGFLLSETPQALEQMEEGIKRVSSIIAAVKNFSHPSQGTRTLSDLNRGIEDTVMISRNEWKYHAELITALSPALPLVPCFLDEFNQVILNMIINAVHAIEDGIQLGRYKRGKILISTGVRENFAMVTIRDDGSGIPTELLPRIFDPFFTTKSIGKGTGQGLAIAHDIIVQRHQGRIEVESEPGKGTTFRLLLPLKTHEAVIPPDSATGRPHE